MYKNILISKKILKLNYGAEYAFVSYNSLATLAEILWGAA